jgi:hypothetical protein
MTRRLAMQVMSALKKGDKADGSVTLVLERRIERQNPNVDVSEVKATRFDY